MGDSNPRLAEAATRFFRSWRDLIGGLLAEAAAQGRRPAAADPAALAELAVSALEGAILLAKASKDSAGLRRTAATLKAFLGCPAQSAETGMTTTAEGRER